MRLKDKIRCLHLATAAVLTELEEIDLKRGDLIAELEQVRKELEQLKETAK